MKFIFGFLVVLFLLQAQFVFAYSTQEASSGHYLCAIEERLYQKCYAQEPLPKRLGRIETSIFGKTSTDEISKRVEYVKTAMGDLNAGEVDKPVVQGNAKYPAVSELEMALFGKSYAGEDIYKRLDNLELTVFKQKSDSSLSDRVDRLRSTIKGEARREFTSQSPYSGVSNSEVIAELEQLEFGTSYSGENIEQRLSRLEQKVFEQTSENDEVNDRVERLVAVINAQPAVETQDDLAQAQKYQKTTKVLTVAGFLLMLLQAVF